MPASIHCEMAQCQPLCPEDDLISTLIAAASHRYTPAAPSPLNPRSSIEPKSRKHAPHHRRPRSSRRKPAETPTERLLRRKAALAYERTTRLSPSLSPTHSTPPPPPPPRRKNGGTVVAARPCSSPEKGPAISCVANEARRAGQTRDKPLAVEWWEIRHRLLADVEGQPAAQLSGVRQRPASRQRLEILLMLVLLSACLTLLTVVGVDSLKGHYIAG
ncbi:hypothetical protein VSDG_00398 [Cytospora chrysosperma]|uniref:Uncharacterized protein n=1 Tax=Cytospora chrysosperma TaxID=252740 RepID=A0A423WNR8_CYTCH|nr:hypothetical protein VSDG_00398 [Valsa sordida]